MLCYHFCDHQENLVHKNVPGSGSEEIEKLIDRYLAATQWTSFPTINNPTTKTAAPLA